MERVPVQISKYFHPTCTGTDLQEKEKGIKVDVMGKLLKVSAVQLATSPAGRQRYVCSADIMFMDKLGIPIRFWDQQATKAYELRGQVVVCFGVFVGEAQENKKILHLSAKGSGRLELANAAVTALCANIDGADKVHCAWWNGITQCRSRANRISLSLKMSSMMQTVLQPRRRIASEGRESSTSRKRQRRT